MTEAVTLNAVAAVAKAATGATNGCIAAVTAVISPCTRLFAVASRSACTCGNLKLAGAFEQSVVSKNDKEQQSKANT